MVGQRLMARRRGLFRLVVKKVRANRKAKRQAAIKQAKLNARHAEQIRKQHRTTAGELKATGNFEWEGAGLPDSTVVEPVMGPNGWEYHPVKTPTRTTKSVQSAQRCGAPTKDGGTCDRMGNCPVPAHKKHRRGK
jgi:hypothetical protein